LWGEPRRKRGRKAEAMRRYCNASKRESSPSRDTPVGGGFKKAGNEEGENSKGPRAFHKVVEKSLCLIANVGGYKRSKGRPFGEKKSA